MKDETGQTTLIFDVSHLGTGDLLNVEVTDDGQGVLTATKFERTI